MKKIILIFILVALSTMAIAELSVTRVITNDQVTLSVSPEAPYDTYTIVEQIPTSLIVVDSWTKPDCGHDGTELTCDFSGLEAGTLSYQVQGQGTITGKVYAQNSDDFTNFEKDVSGDSNFGSSDLTVLGEACDSKEACTSDNCLKNICVAATNGCVDASDCTGEFAEGTCVNNQCIKPQCTSPSLKLDQQKYVSGEDVFIVLVSPEDNTNSLQTESVTVTVFSQDFELFETGDDIGIFVGQTIFAGALLEVSYVDSCGGETISVTGVLSDTGVDTAEFIEDMKQFEADNKDIVDEVYQEGNKGWTLKFVSALANFFKGIFG